MTFGSRENIIIKGRNKEKTQYIIYFTCLKCKIKYEFNFPH